MNRAGSAVVRFAGLTEPQQLLVGLSARRPADTEPVAPDGADAGRGAASPSDRAPGRGEPVSIDEVFTRAERLRSGAGRTLEHWAGRLAAKYAVLRLLAVAETAEHLGQAEVLPQPSPMCAATAACLHGHPPRVRLSGDLARRAAERGGEQIRVSISHTRDTALSVAIASAPLPEDHHCEAA
ncbi:MULTISPECIES: hypothetical protein [Actinoalloteichus]|uniref:Phosphopantetheinyl transferase (Holo-ACP synthase) n=1 Tax=Actinoalloteichus fjordicus TaxID=1612552 RepID=A0AAC9L8U9_9PSEU|nr:MULTISPECIES: hypothetical protein [Actinoalloteichus]APU13227.1 phosphopantetheinyl transferase (holo-ACP synthase) [Actinoalloteichus fjordicus]APU19178.1 phosphopantetheinyl transferase (holo-ACP synthase) [Actinoalloteichus sp. GBA129-24]